MKLLNSDRDLVKLSQIIKIKKVLREYKDRKLESIEKNLIKGIFVRKPAKFFLEDETPR